MTIDASTTRKVSLNLRIAAWALLVGLPAFVFGATFAWFALHRAAKDGGNDIDPAAQYAIGGLIAGQLLLFVAIGRLVSLMRTKLTDGG
jgi:hypothetical protein